MERLIYEDIHIQAESLFTSTLVQNAIKMKR